MAVVSIGHIRIDYLGLVFNKLMIKIKVGIIRIVIIIINKKVTINLIFKRSSRLSLDLVKKKNWFI